MDDFLHYQLKKREERRMPESWRESDVDGPDVPILPSRITLSEALADVLLRFSSRKFIVAILGVAVLLFAMTQHYIAPEDAIKAILGILATYGALEGVPDTIERMRRMDE